MAVPQDRGSARLRDVPTPANGADPRRTDSAAAVGDPSRLPAGTLDPQVTGGGDCLLVTRDDALADHVALVAAAAGAVLHVVRDVTLAGEAHGSILLLGPDAALAEEWHLTSGPVILVGYVDSEDRLWKAAARRPGSRVAVLPRAAAWLGEFLGELGLRGGPGRVLLVAGTAGGAGATTVAALTAAAATLDGARALLIDADPHSPGLWPVLRAGASGTIGWEDLARSRGQVAPSQLAEILPRAQGTAVLTWSARTLGQELPGQVLGEVVAASRRIFDTVVIDVGRSAGVDAALVAVADQGLAVVPGRVGAPAGWLPGHPESALRWDAVVTGRLPAGADAARVASTAGLDVACYLPDFKAIRSAGAEGRLLAALGRRNVRSTLRPLITICRVPGAAPAIGRSA